MNKLIRLGFILSTIILMRCAPMSKDSYMREFYNFTQEVSQNCKTYNSDKWEKMEKKYNDFSGQWYEKYKDKMSMKEKLLVRSYQAKWWYNRGSSILNDVVEVEQLIRFYVENDMQSDLKILCEEAHRIGGETEKTVDEILKKLDVQTK